METSSTPTECHPGGTRPGHLVPGFFFLLFFTTVYVLDISHSLRDITLYKGRTGEAEMRSGDVLNDKRFLLYFGIFSALASVGGGFMELVPSFTPTGRPWFVSCLHLALYTSWLLPSIACLLQRSNLLGQFAVFLSCCIASWFNAVILSGHLEQHKEMTGAAMSDLHLWLCISSLLSSLTNGVATLSPRSFRLRSAAYCSISIHGGWWVTTGIIAFSPNDGICTFNAGWIPSIFVFSSTVVIVVYVLIWLYMLKYDSRRGGMERTLSSEDVDFFTRSVGRYPSVGYDVVGGTDDPDDDMVVREKIRIKEVSNGATCVTPDRNEDGRNAVIV